MKLKLITILFINYITTTRRGDISEASLLIKIFSEERINELNEMYETSGDRCELRNAVNWIIHYICNEEDRTIIKNELIATIKICLYLNYVENNEKILLRSMINKIKSGGDLQNFSKNEFFEILLIYYYYEHSPIAQEQTEINKKIFENILKYRKDIDTLQLRVHLISGSDFHNLIKAMSKNLKKLTLLKSSNVDILRTLNKCKELLKNPIELAILNYEPDLKYLNDLSNELANANIEKFTIYSLNLSSLEPILILKYILNNKNIKELSINHSYLTESDINDVITALKNDEMQIKCLYLNDLKIDENSYCRLLEECRNNKKLKELLIKEIQINPIISKKISEILKEKNSLEAFGFISDQIKSENIQDIAQELKNNNTLVELDIRSKNLQLKDYTLMLNSILKNRDSNIKRILFEGREDLYRSANYKDKEEFYNAKKDLLSKSVLFVYNWKKINNRKCCIS